MFCNWQKDSERSLRYIYHPETAVIVKAISRNDAFNIRQTNWYNPYFIRPETILTVKRTGNSKWALVRANGDNDFELNIEESHKKNDANISKVETELSSLVFSSVEKAADNSEKYPETLLLKDQDGLEYIMHFKVMENSIHLQLSFAAEIDDNRAASMTDAEIEELTEFLDSKINGLKSRFANWTFIIDRKSAESFYFKISDLSDYDGKSDVFTGTNGNDTIEPGKEDGPEEENDGPLKFD